MKKSEKKDWLKEKDLKKIRFIIEDKLAYGFKNKDNKWLFETINALLDHIECLELEMEKEKILACRADQSIESGIEFIENCIKEVKDVKGRFWDNSFRFKVEVE